MTNFEKLLEFAVTTGKVTMAQALDLAEQHARETEAWKEAKKYARPFDFSRVGRHKRLIWK